MSQSVVHTWQNSPTLVGNELIKLTTQIQWLRASVRLCSLTPLVTINPAGEGPFLISFQRLA